MRDEMRKLGRLFGKWPTIEFGLYADRGAKRACM